MRQYKGKKICIICEGFEELEYFETLKSKAVFSNKYDFKTINAKSFNNIMPIYQDKYQSDSYYLILIFCDTDRGPSNKYLELKDKLNNFHGENIAKEIIIFGNPCTLQIILSHFSKVKLITQNKAINSKFVEKCTGIKNYKASEEQRKELFSKIKRDNYHKMKENIKELSTDDREESSTNILSFLEKFESDDDSWIDNINNKL